jgi:prophage antirepressor-like protein
MTKELTVFKFQGKKDVRVVERDGEPWFVAKDVAGVLGYSDPSMMVKRMDSDEKMSVKMTGISKTNPVVVLINESGLYNAIIGSKKPDAKKFRKWVTSEVLPSIRKNGGYIKGQENLNPDQFAQLMGAVQSLTATVAELTRDMVQVKIERAEDKKLLETNLSVDAYRAFYAHEYWTKRMRVTMGIKASVICRKMGLTPAKEDREFFIGNKLVTGQVNLYPKDVLDKVYIELME